MAKEKIRIHNRGKRDFTIPPPKAGGKQRMLPAGRAIEIEKDLAEKMIAAYPKDLIEFDSLVSGEKRDISRENARLESENQKLKEENQRLNIENDGLRAGNEKSLSPEPKTGNKKS